MHIVLCSRSFPHHRPGGMEWHVQDIAEGLMSTGHEVSVITTPLPPTPALKQLEVNGRILTIGNHPGRYGGVFITDFIRKVPSFLREVRPDVVHCQGYTGLFAFDVLPRSTPLVTTIHGTLWSETPLRQGGERPTWQLRWRYKHRYGFSPFWCRFLRRDPFLIADSTFTKTALEQEAGHPLTQVTVVPLGFDLSRFPALGREAARASWGIAPGEIALVAVGRIEQTKGFEYVIRGFLEVAEQHPQSRLLVAGDGNCLEHLRSLAAASPLGSRIRFTGRVSSPKLPSLLQAADVFLNADQGAPAFGLANAEAICMGTPVLATDVGAHGEVVAEGDGWLVKAGDQDAWNAAMARMLAQLPEPHGSRHERAARGRARFGRDAMIESLVAVYRRVQAREEV